MTTQAAIETPTDTPTDEASSPKAKRKKPTAANRYILFDDEGGDYRIYEIARKDSNPNLPQGALLPIAAVPGFVSTYLAKKFISNSGNQLEGKQLMIIKGLEICSVDVVTVTNVAVKFKPKKAVTGPAATSGEEGQ